LKGNCDNGCVVICILLLSYGCSSHSSDLPGGGGRLNPSEGFADPQVVALAKAAQLGDIAEIDRLVSAGVDVNTLGREGITPLLWAFISQNKDGFKRLLEHKANPNVETQNGDSVIRSVAEFASDSEWLALVLKHGGNPNYVPTRNRFAGSRTPIFDAINKHHTKGVELLLEAGAKIDQMNRDGTTPLEYSFHFRHYDIVYQLLTKGADYRVKDFRGKDIASMILEPDSFIEDADSQAWRNRVIKFLKEHLALQDGKDSGDTNRL
jgi:ankyrin repeat protein